MTVHHLPSRKPSREQLDLPIVTIVGLLHDLSAKLMKHEGALQDAKNADDFVEALKATHEEISQANAGFSALVDETRDWR